MTRLHIQLFNMHIEQIQWHHCILFDLAWYILTDTEKKDMGVYGITLKDCRAHVNHTDKKLVWKLPNRSQARITKPLYNEVLNQLLKRRDLLNRIDNPDTDFAFLQRKNSGKTKLRIDDQINVRRNLPYNPLDAPGGGEPADIYPPPDAGDRGAEAGE